MSFFEDAANAVRDVISKAEIAEENNKRREAAEQAYFKTRPNELFNSVVDKPRNREKEYDDTLFYTDELANGATPDEYNVFQGLSDSEYDYFIKNVTPHLENFDNFLDAYANEKDTKMRSALIDIYSKMTPLRDLPVTGYMMNILDMNEKAIQQGNWDESIHGPYDPRKSAAARRRELKDLMDNPPPHRLPKKA